MMMIDVFMAEVQLQENMDKQQSKQQKRWRDGPTDGTKQTY